MKINIREEFYNYLLIQRFSDTDIEIACDEIPETAIICGITREVAIRDFLVKQKMDKDPHLIIFDSNYDSKDELIFTTSTNKKINLNKAIKGLTLPKDEFEDVILDRRAGKRNTPFVGKQPRSRTNSGKWKKKKRNAGKPKKRR